METVREAADYRRSVMQKTGDSILRSRGKTGSTPGRIRVGIADVSKYFPQLSQILITLNAAQTAFEFESVKVAIPLGVWQYKDWGPEEGGKIRYLWAERLAAKLKHHPKRLGVDYLICATNHWMRDNKFYGLYGWWTAEKDCPVMLFSTGGLALPRNGSTAGIVVANAIVQALAAQICEETGATCQIHEDAPINCPFYYNEERLTDSIAGINTFDPACRAYLADHIPKSLHGVPRAMMIQALQQLLRCFGPLPQPPPTSAS
jgi:hypothetical protein